MDLELQKKLCYLYWDIFNSPELRALSPSTSHPTALQYSSFVLSIVTCIIGLPANIVVILVTGFLMKKNKHKIWFLNLALADFTFLLFLPLYAVSVIRAEWRFGSSMCKFYNYLLFVNTYGGVYTLMALNIDRAVSVAKPVWHLRFRSWRFYCCICAAIWVSSAIFNIPTIIYSGVYNTSEHQCLFFPDDLTSFVYLNNDQNSSTSQMWRSLSRHTCEESFENTENFKKWREVLPTIMSLSVPHALIGYVIPLCVILFSNTIIALQVKNSRQLSSSRLYRVVIAAVLVFFCTRTPIILAHCIVVVAAHTLQFTLMYKAIVVLPLLISIAATDTFLNPMVYVLLGKQVRNEISKFLRKR